MCSAGLHGFGKRFVAARRHMLSATSMSGHLRA